MFLIDFPHNNCLYIFVEVKKEKKYNINYTIKIGKMVSILNQSITELEIFWVRLYVFFYLYTFCCINRTTVAMQENRLET